MNILLVDDEVATIRIMQEAVNWKRLGFQEVYTAFNAQEAKDVLDSRHVDISICDIEMPGEDGLSLIRWMQDMYPGIISIILTGFPDFNYARSAISLGVYRYLLKPVSFEELEQTLMSAVEKLEEEKAYEAAGEKAAGNGSREQEYTPVQQARKYIEEHCSEVITRRDIESLLHMNQDYINREFKKTEGYTLMEYVQYCRIRMAKQLLRETNLSVSDISIRTGYDSPAYFSKVFRKWTGMTPMEYRESRT